MKTTAALALCVLTLSVTGCTTSDDTPPGSGGSLAEAEESDEAEGIPDEEQSEAVGPEGDAVVSERPKGNEDEGDSPEEGNEAANDGDANDEGDGPGEENTRDLPDPEAMSEDVCVTFFEGAAPIALRVQDTRGLVTLGVVTDLSPVEYQEIDVLAERLDSLSDDADEDLAALLVSINSPFTEVQLAATEGGTDEESGEVSYESVEMSESEEAQEEFTAECSGSTDQR